MTTNAEPIKANHLGEGIIRLYREFESEDEEHNREHSSPLISNSNSIKQDLKVHGDNTMVCIVAIPTYFTAIDLLGFIGKYYIEEITHIRILKSEKQNRFLVLIKFENESKAAEFQQSFNGKPFNSMEPETCHTIFVKYVHIDSNTIHENVDDIPYLLNDPFTTHSKKQFDLDIESQNLVELPTCPVCLERMDSSVTGLLTIPCQHTFHCQCLSKWKDDTCPICRYSNNVSNQKARRSVRRVSTLRRSSLNTSTANNTLGINNSVFTTTGNETCSECNASESLWICLICGNLGCDRYAPQQHSLNHFIQTGHCFAMEVETSRVWDYAGDAYVHRLVTNEADGKLVELPEKVQNVASSSLGIFDGFGSNSTGPSNFSNPKLATSNDANFDKVDEVGFEYSQLLISQLASQREYFESLMETNKSKNENLIHDLEKKLDEVTLKFNEYVTNVIPKLERKIQTKDEKINKITRELNEANKLNEGLSEKIEYITDENSKLKDTTIDLEEQVKDLMFYLETQEKFKDKSEEDKEGTVVMQAPSKISRSRRKKKK